MTKSSNLIMHIGWQKTGTSALQAFCYENAELLNEYDIAYYRTNGHSVGSVSNAIAKGEDVQKHSDQFHEWRASQTARNTLLSAEGLATNSLQGIAEFIKPQDWSEITVIVYIRSQVEFHEGWYKQHVKWGSKLSVDQYLRRNIWHLADYDRYLAGWVEWCAQHPVARLIVRKYDPQDLSLGNIGSDFFSALGLPPDPFQTEMHNVSPSSSLIEMYLRLPAIKRIELINRKFVKSGIPGVTGKNDLFDVMQREKIRAFYGQSNELVRQKFFPEQSELFEDRTPSALMHGDRQMIKDGLIAKIAEMRGEQVAQMAREHLLDI